MQRGLPIMSHAPHQRGFTLIELMASVSVLAVLTVVGVPSFTQLLERQRIDAVTQRLEADLTLARTTALARRQPVIVCPRGGDGSCAPGLDWSGGWVVALEHPPHSGVAGEILWVQAAPGDSGDGMQVGATRPLLRYRNDGTSSGSNLSIRLCLRGNLVAQHIVNNTGRARSQREAGDAPCPL